MRCVMWIAFHDKKRSVVYENVLGGAEKTTPKTTPKNRRRL